jgi:hypothetical protein
MRPHPLTKYPFWVQFSYYELAFLTLLQLVFLAAKLLFAQPWSWAFTLAPMWLTAAIMVVLAWLLTFFGWLRKRLQ